jgi:uncharacterized protein (DUF1800 family)
MQTMLIFMRAPRALSALPVCSALALAALATAALALGQSPSEPVVPALQPSAPERPAPAAAAPSSVKPGARKVVKREPAATAAKDPLLEWSGPRKIAHSDLLVHAPADFVWTAREVEHLSNRAGFGARPLDIAAGVALGPDAFVSALLRGPVVPEEPFWAEPCAERDGVKPIEALTADEKKALQAQLRTRDRQQLAAYTHWWFERMLAGKDPLRERMTLYWHGHFTSSMQDVKSSWQMIRQNQFLRENAFGRFADLVHGIARDPAMLEYLDNNSNRSTAPNENFARELLELYTLGLGHFTEQDVKEAARAFTGWSGKGAEFRVNAKQHDRGAKTVFGESGRWSGDEVIEIVLRQPACAEHVAGRLIAWFEGRVPERERVVEYAAFLREHDYEVWALLNKLFLDPRFYRDEVVGMRISGPIDYLVGSARRLGATPPPALLEIGARALGQQLFEPPNVKGWEGGASWITTATFMQRGNLAGMLLGVVEAADILAPEPELLAAEPRMEAAPSMEAASAPQMETLSGTAPAAETKPAAKKPTAKRGELLAQFERFDQQGWRPAIHLSARLELRGARNDEQRIDALADELLARPLPPETRAHMLGVFAAERRENGVGERVTGGPRDSALREETILRRVAHVLLSLPEAQLD